MVSVTVAFIAALATIIMSGIGLMSYTYKYGREKESRVQAHDEFEEGIESLREEINKVKNEQLEELKEQHGEMRSAHRNMHEDIEHISDEVNGGIDSTRKTCGVCRKGDDR